MQIYLPIAEVSVDLILLLVVGAGVGLISGMFGVGGGFLVTPLLIFIGIPPAVAVSTEAAQICASSVSGALTHLRRRTLDVRMGLLLSAGGAAGSVAGVAIFRVLKDSGQIDAFVAISYVVFLGAVGSLMLREALVARQRAKAGERPRRRKRVAWFAGLPLKMRFPASGLYESVLPPLGIGALVGMLAALMGVGGGFIMIPAMIYLLRMPTNVVIGTSLFQITFVTGLTTVLQATQNQTVDLLLALCLIAGGVVGTQIGVRFAGKVRAETLRAALAALVLGVAAKLLIDLLATPRELFTIQVLPP